MWKFWLDRVSRAWADFIAEDRDMPTMAPVRAPAPNAATTQRGRARLRSGRY